MKFHTETHERGEYTITVSLWYDQCMGEPWKEHDGHGIVSDWEHRDKRPGERVLVSDRSSARFYDMAATMKKAKAEGWGLGDDAIAALARKLGRKPTQGEIVAASVEHDFEFIRGWCRDEWHWVGWTVTVTRDGKVISKDSCGGIEGTDDGQKYAIGEAIASGERSVERDQLVTRETEIAACYP